MKKIMMIDDDVMMLTFLECYLGQRYDLHTFSNPKQGLEWLKEGNTPDLIISDLHMPEMKGDELFEALRNEYSLAHVPFILFSILDNQEEQRRWKKQGIDEFVAKPFRPDSLFEKINQLIIQ